MQIKSKNTVAIIAPHADDEALGCAGTIKVLHNAGYNIHWILVTDMSTSTAYSVKQKEVRARQIAQIKNYFSFHSTVELRYEPATLSDLPKRDLIGRMKGIFEKIKPEIIFIPYRNDVHSDHREVYDACVAASKVFRTPFIKKTICYETLSETEFELTPEMKGFNPNVFVNITAHMEYKLGAIEIYDDQLGEFPFPRSYEAVVALSKYRGLQAGYLNAEAFMLLKDLDPFERSLND
jgi:N-acetylglucosamine malate deacetylase 1